MFDGRPAQLLVHGLRVSASGTGVTRPVKLWVLRTTDLPWGHVGPGFEIGPAGTVFDDPVTIEFDLDEIDLPPGTRAESLRVGTVENGRWVPLPDDDAAAGPAVTSGASGSPIRMVSASLRHLSPYGLVADPHEVSGAGRRLESNGVVAETADEVFGRLFVSPAIVTLYLDGGDVDSTALTLSGLPTDDSHVLYVDSHAHPRTIRPSDGGTVTMPLDLSSPHYLWLQPYAGTVVIGGPGDACATVGVRSGSTCTLTSDVADTMAVAENGQTLDCDGHAIVPPVAWPGQGVGIEVSQVEGTTVRRCNIGEPGRGFAIGIDVFSAPGTTISECLLTDDPQGIVVSTSGGTTVRDNRITGEVVSGISVQDMAWTGADGSPPPAPVEVSGNTIDVVSGEKAAGIDLRGTSAAFKDGAGGVTLAPASVHDNVVEGGGNGIVLASVTNADIYQNDLNGSERGLLILDGGWPNRFYHNNVTATAWGVMDAREGLGEAVPPAGDLTYKEPSQEPPAGPAGPPEPVEVSWLGEGSWWGHSCSEGPLFAPGADSNAAHVRDSFAYESRNAWLTGGVPGCPGDRDGDTVPDAVDNCPDVPNPDQQNIDGFGEGDACDVTAPAPPVIMRPAPWSLITTTTPRVEGTAERHARVALYDFGVPVGHAVADSAGGFALLPETEFAEGDHYLTARATDAAGNQSGESAVVPLTVDTVAPPPPVILVPLQGEIVATPAPAIGGTAEAGSDVRIYDAGALIGHVEADEDGRFSAGPIAPLANGRHTLTATATDRAGHVSRGSPTVAFTVLVVSPVEPIEGDRGEIRVTSLADAPDPFDPALEEVVLSMSAELSGLWRLAAWLPIFRYEVVLRWSIREGDTGEPTRNLVSSTVVPRPRRPSLRPIPVEASLTWDGRDAAGESVAPARVYPYDVHVVLVRVWTGPGRGPRCLPWEATATTPAGVRACVIDRLDLEPAGTIATTEEPSARRCDGSFAEPSVSISAPRVTPDANGIFDSTALAVALSADPATLRCGSGDDDFDYLVRCRLRLMDSPQHAAREFVDVRALAPAPDWSETARCATARWAGADAQGRRLPDGSYRVAGDVTVSVVSARTGIEFPLRGLDLPESVVVLSGDRDDRELAWAEARRIEGEEIGTRTGSLILDDYPFLYETASPGTLDRLAQRLVVARGVDLQRAFDGLVAEMEGELPPGAVRPTGEQLGLWRDLYLRSSGRVLVRWSTAGTPVEVLGLDDGIAAGGPEAVARAFLSRFEGEIRTLFRMQPHDRFTLDRVREDPRDPRTYVAVQFRREVLADQAGASGCGASYPVMGDVLSVVVRTRGLAAGTGRVMSLRAEWRPLRDPVGCAMASDDARERAASLSGLATPSVRAVSEPFIHFSSAAEHRLLYRALVTDGPQQRHVFLDAVTGGLYQNADAVRYSPDRTARVTYYLSPWTRDTAARQRDCAVGLPMAEVCDASGARCVTTDMHGNFPVDGFYPGETLVASFRGPWVKEDRLGSDPAAFPRVFLTDTPFREDQLWAIPGATYAIDFPPFEYPPAPGESSHPLAGERVPSTQIVGSTNYNMGLLFGHANWQAYLYDRVGIRAPTEPPTMIHVDWGPQSVQHRCEVDPGDPDWVTAQCGGCDSLVDRCRGDSWDDDFSFWEPSDPGNLDTWPFHDAECATDLPPKCDVRDTDGVPSDPPLLCDFSYGSDPTSGYCSWTAINDAVWLPGGCWNQVTRTATPWECIQIDRNSFQCVKPGGCPSVYDDGNDLARFLEPRRWLALGTLTHEMTHAIGSTGLAPESPGRMAAFLPEGLAFATPWVFYDDIAFWDNAYETTVGGRPVYPRPEFWGAEFHGDPLSGEPTGGPYCSSPEDDDPADSYVCPRAAACAHGQCMVRAARLDATCCPVPLASCPSDVQSTVRCVGADAFLPIDSHDNNAWFVETIGHLVLFAGRWDALQALSWPAGSQIMDDTTAARGPNSLFARMLRDPWYPGRGIAPWGAQVQSAFGRHVRDDPPVTPPVVGAPDIDPESGLPFQSSFVSPTEPLALGEYEFRGRLTADEWADTFTAYLVGGREYHVWFGASGGEMTLGATPDPSSGGRALYCSGWRAGWGTEWAVRENGVGTFVPPATGYYSFAVLGWWCPSGSCDYMVEITAVDGDDYPDLAADAVPLPSNVPFGIAGRLGDPGDVDRFRVFANRLPMEIRIDAVTGFVPEVEIRAPSGAELRCEFTSAFLRGCTVTAGAADGTGWYAVSIGAPPGTSGSASYVVRTRWPDPSTPGIACSRLEPPSTPADAGGDACVVGRGGAGIAPPPVLSRSLVDLATPDELWAYLEKGHIAALEPLGSVELAVHGPNYGEPTGSLWVRRRPWTSTFPLFTIPGGEVQAFVAPVTGWYRLEVRAAATTTGYSLRFYTSEFETCDFPNIVEATGGSCELPPGTDTEVLP